MSIQPDIRDEWFAKLVAFRVVGQSDDSIASGLGFSSPRALYETLAKAGFSICWWCGGLRLPEDHECGRPKPREKQERKAQPGEGEWTELPPAEDAAELLREVLANLTRAVDGLGDRHEGLQDRRFVAEDHFDEPIYWFRHHFSFTDERWRALAEALGQDPDADHLEMSPALSAVFLRGASRTPADPLTALIAMAVLAGRDVKELVEKLHPDPEQADYEGIRYRIEGGSQRPGLLKLGEELAILLRGGEIKRGAQPGLSAREQHHVHYIHRRRDEGAPDEEILGELQSEEPTLDRSELRRLGDYDLDLP